MSTTTKTINGQQVQVKVYAPSKRGRKGQTSRVRGNIVEARAIWKDEMGLAG